MIFKSALIEATRSVICLYIHCIICLGKVSEEIKVSSDTQIIVGILLNACHLVQVEFLFIFDLHLLCVHVCLCVCMCMGPQVETIDNL